jgi:hypothetical protein
VQEIDIAPFMGGHVEHTSSLSHVPAAHATVHKSVLLDPPGVFFGVHEEQVAVRLLEELVHVTPEAAPTIAVHASQSVVPAVANVPTLHSLQVPALSADSSVRRVVAPSI